MLLLIDAIVDHLTLDLHDLILLVRQVGHFVEDKSLLLVVAGIDEVLALLHILLCTWYADLEDLRRGLQFCKVIQL